MLVLRSKIGGSDNSRMGWSDYCDLGAVRVSFNSGVVIGVGVLHVAS